MTHESETGALYDILVQGTKVGWADISPANYVFDIYIDKDKRNQGYGTAAIKKFAADLGTIYLAPDSEDSQRLYDRLGEAVVENSYIYNTWGGDVDQGFGLYQIG